MHIIIVDILWQIRNRREQCPIVFNCFPLGILELRQPLAKICINKVGAEHREISGTIISAYYWFFIRQKIRQQGDHEHHANETPGIHSQFVLPELLFRIAPDTFACIFYFLLQVSFLLNEMRGSTIAYKISATKFPTSVKIAVNIITVKMTG